MAEHAKRSYFDITFDDNNYMDKTPIQRFLYIFFGGAGKMTAVRIYEWENRNKERKIYNR